MKNSSFKKLMVKLEKSVDYLLALDYNFGAVVSSFQSDPTFGSITNPAGYNGPIRTERVK